MIGSPAYFVALSAARAASTDGFAAASVPALLS
jgi:hypothetical protein